MGEHRQAGLPDYLVAVKTLKSSASDARDELMREACFMAQLNCDYIVRLHGVVTVGEPFMMVMEYCEFGSLQAYLKERDLSHTDKLTLAHDAAEGLRYLASRNIVHRDIAARNVLLNSELRGRIADFGMVRECIAGRRRKAPARPYSHRLCTRRRDGGCYGALVRVSVYLFGKKSLGKSDIEKVKSRAASLGLRSFCLASTLTTFPFPKSSCPVPRSSRANQRRTAHTTPAAAVRSLCAGLHQRHSMSTSLAKRATCGRTVSFCTSCGPGLSCLTKVSVISACGLT